MSKLLNIGAAVAFAVTASLPMASFAQEDSEVTVNWKEMGQKLGRGMANVNRMDAAEISSTLTEIRPFIVANADLTPDVLAGASEAELAAWHADVMYALGMFDAASAAADAGEADAAKAIMGAFNTLREDMHEKYGI